MLNVLSDDPPFTLYLSTLYAANVPIFMPQWIFLSIYLLYDTSILYLKKINK